MSSPFVPAAVFAALMFVFGLVGWGGKEGIGLALVGGVCSFGLIHPRASWWMLLVAAASVLVALGLHAP